MRLSHFFYQTADTEHNGALVIGATLPQRERYMCDVFLSLYADIIASFQGSTTLKTALLYVGGAGEHHSLCRDHQPLPHSSAVVKSQLGYAAHKYALKLGNIDYMSINSNACASSMYAIYEAQNLIEREGFDEVIIVGEEWVEPNELLLYKQLGIGITCSDGFVIARFVRNELATHSCAKFEKSTWQFHLEGACLKFSKEGYAKVINAFDSFCIDIVKTHGTSTPNNTEAEEGAINICLGVNTPRLYYKDKIGHSQGVSALLEICQSLDYKSLINKNILALASGLGNFYGGVLYRREV